MRLIYKTILILSTFFICCCKQDKGEQNTSTIKTDSNKSRHTDAWKEKIKSKKERQIPKTPEEAYDALIENYNELQVLLNTPKEFNSSFITEIGNFFGVDYDLFVKNNFYPSVGFDITTINNLKKMITTFNPTKKPDIPGLDVASIHQLSLFTKELIRPIDNAFKENNQINILKNSNDVKALNELINMLDNLYEKWDTIVNLIQTIINEAAKLNKKDDVTKKFKLLNDLHLGNFNQICNENGVNNEVCELKNEMGQLSKNIKNKIESLIESLVDN
ncbi:hypothetical protein BDCR2A_01121 [Borrelia duttonii CR2A]|uniref:Antigen P35 n=1 Tax=Borrelia duttonii CR2A TaxID=1432657 RepID=W6TXP6_9SPIR|nr:hypothetical protein [Borrelia duttonii]ETZ17926.1 hypothetical protein BDCR2A_01121 [Borrelia duttonii CR2A]